MRRLVTPFIFLCTVCVLLVSSASAQKVYSPRHPEVLGMISRGVDYLRQHEADEGDIRVKALIGLAIFNAVQDADDPAVRAALDAVSEHIRTQDMSDERNQERGPFQTIYYPCVAMLLLAEVDHVKYKDEIQKILDWLLERQDAQGGWGYWGRSSSDISQSQYGCLALWLANFKGFKIPGNAAVKAAGVFVNFQRQDGAWVYQVGGGNDGIRSQNEVYPSRVAAGSSSLYAMSNLLELDPSQIRARIKKNATERIEELPIAVIEVFDEEEDAKAVGGLGDVDYPKGLLDAAKARADRWFAANYSVDTGFWNYYYHYGYERYVTFYELQNGSIAHHQDWYDRGVRFMKGKQGADGSWAVERMSGTEENAVVCTCFAILYLTRSTRNIIGAPIGGTVTIGQKLPDPEDGPVTVDDNGNIVSTNVARSVSDLINNINSASDEELERMLKGVESLELFDSGNDESRNEKIAKLRDAIEHPNWQVRRLVVKFLAKQRNIDNAPALIYALSDPDVRVARMAHDGLRMLSRKIDAISVSDSGSDDEQLTAFKVAKEKWEEWYLRLRPTAQLLDK